MKLPGAISTMTLDQERIAIYPIDARGLFLDTRRRCRPLQQQHILMNDVGHGHRRTSLL